MKNPKDQWQQCNSETFWSEIAVCDHVVQLYNNEGELLHMLEDFVVGGISVSDTVIIIATDVHLQLLKIRLSDADLQIDLLQQQNQLVLLDAALLLSKFMVDGKPNKDLFKQHISEVFNTVKPAGKPLRAFGEMVALLWQEGLSEATIELENFWNELAITEAFSLYCAYPKTHFTENAIEELSHICKSHAKLISNSKADARFSVSFLDI